MSSIDKRVVELVFDNSKFDKNVEQSRGTLDRLKKDLKFEGATQGIENVSESIKRFSLNNVGEAIGTVTARFSTLEIIGKRVLENLTDAAMRFGSNLVSSIAEPITSGGWSRALKLEQANFQLRGLLGETAEGAAKIEAIMDSVSKSVKGTAYGLDDAAKVASQLVATGIEDSQEMLSYLKGVAGAAAMTGGSYEDIGRIFTTVAGQGRLMGDQLLQFATRGVNVAATLSKQMNITEAEFRDLVSKGQISFKQFADGMALAFGEHAYKANETFTGSLSNMRAALARIGADIATPALTNLRDIFNALRPLIDNVHDALKPLIDTLNNDLTHATKKTVEFINELSDKVETFVKGFKKESDTAEESAEVISNSADEIEEMARRVMAGEFGNGEEERRRQLEELGYSFEEVQNKVNELTNNSYRYEVQERKTTEAEEKHVDASEKLAKQQKQIDDFYRRKSINNFFESLRNVVKYFGQYATAAHEAFKEVFDGSLLKNIYDLGVRFKLFTKSLILNNEQTDGLKTVFKALFSILKAGLNIVGFFVDKFFALVGIFSDVKDRILEFVGSLDKTNEAFDETSRKAKFVEAIKTAFEKLIEIFEIFKIKIKLAVDAFKQTDGFKHLYDSLTNLWELIKEVAGSLFDRFIGKLNEFGEYQPDVSWVDKFAEWLGKAADKLAVFIDLIVSKKADFKEFIDTIKGFFNKDSSDEVRNGFIQGFSDSLKGWSLKDAFSGLKDAIIGATGENINDAMKSPNMFENIKGYFQKIADILSLVNWDFILKHLTKIVLVFAVVKTLLSMSSVLSAASTLINGLSTKLKLKNNAVSSFQEFGKAVLAIAASLFLVALIPPEELEKALFTLGLVSAAIIGVIALFGSMGRKGTLDMNGAKAMAKDFLQMSISIGILALAISVLGNMKAEELLKAELTIGTLIAIMAVAANSVSTVKKATGSFVLMALAVDALIPAMLVFGLMPIPMLLKGGATILALMMSLAAATRVAESAIGGAASMAIMALAVTALIPPMLVFGAMPIERLVQAGIAIVSLLTALAVACTVAKSAVRGAASMAIMAAAVLALIPPVLVFGYMPVDRLVVAGVTIAALLTELAVACSIAQSNVRGALSMAIMAVPIVAAATSLLILSVVPLDKMLAGALMLSTLMFALVTCTKYAESSLKGALSMAIMAVPIVAAALALRALAEMPIGGMLAAAVSLIAVMAAITFATKIAAGNIEGAVVMLAMTIPLGAAVASLAALAQFDWKNLLAAAGALSMLFLSISGAIFILQAVPISAGFKALALLGTFFVGLAAIVAVMAGLFGEGGKFPGLMDKAVPVMESFGKAIGGFIGSIIESISESVSSSLERFGEAIGNFGDSIVPFIDAAKQVDEAVLGGILRLCEAVLAITATEFISNLTSFFGLGDSALEKFGKELVAFSEQFVIYAKNVKGIGEDTVTGSAAAASVLADMYKKVTDSGISGGVLGLIEGKPLQKFGEELAKFGPHIKSYAKDVSEINAGSVSSSAMAASMLATMYKTMVEAGVKDEFFTKEPLVAFGKELENFGPKIKAYSDAIIGIDMAAVTASALAGQMLVNLYTTVTNAGITGGLFESSPLTKFAEELVIFGNKMQEYITSAIVISDNSIQIANANAATIGAATMAMSLVNVDCPSMNAFGIALVDLGNNLLSYANNIALISFVTMAEAVNSIYSLIYVSGSMVGIDTGAITMFGDAIAEYGRDLQSFYNSVKNINTSTISKAIASTYKLIEVGKAMADVKDSAMSKFGDTLENVGKKGVDAFINSFTSANVRAYDAARALVMAALNGANSGSSYSSWWSIGMYCANGLANGLASGTGYIQQAAYNAAIMALNSARAALGVYSPSREFYKIGDFSIQGFVNAFNDGARDVFGAGETMGDVALKALTRPVELIQQMLDTDLDLTPTITPVLDLTDLANGTTTANGLLSGISGQMFANSLNVGSIHTGETEASYQSKQLDRVLGILSQLADEDSINPVNNTFNIYGDDPRAIADEVSRIIQRQVERREASWA